MNIPGYDQSPMPALSGADDGDPQDDAMPQGDGLRHHEIHEMPDGSAHSTSTKEDGSVEEMDHDSYEDACANCAGAGEDEGEEDSDGEEGGNAAFPGDDDGSMNIAASYGRKQ